MSTPGQEKTTSSGSAPPTDAPDWDLVPFKAACARCGYDLRGLSEPVCPQCKFEFDWAEAVPIERLVCPLCEYHLYGLNDPRCPECGQSFTWETALAVYHARRLPHFEHLWRKRPMRSFIGTWVRALRPGKLWRNMSIHDPPRVVPLLLMTLLALGAVVAGVPTFLGVLEWYWAVWLPMPLSGGGSGLGDLPGYLIRAFIRPNMRVLLSPPLLWAGFSLMALMVFQQSMRIHKVRTVHVVRVWAYSVPFVPVMFAVAVVVFEVTLSLLSTERMSDRGMLALLFASATFVVWSLRQGYHHYLRMPHALAVAIVSQLVGILAMATAMEWIRLLL